MLRSGAGLQEIHNGIHRERQVGRYGEVWNQRHPVGKGRSHRDRQGKRVYYYTGPMRPGESISFAEMLRYNQIDTRRVDMLPKLNGNDIMPANIMPGESRQSLCYR